MPDPFAGEPDWVPAPPRPIAPGPGRRPARPARPPGGGRPARARLARRPARRRDGGAGAAGPTCRSCPSRSGTAPRPSRPRCSRRWCRWSGSGWRRAANRQVAGSAPPGRPAGLAGRAAAPGARPPVRRGRSVCRPAGGQWPTAPSGATCARSPRSTRQRRRHLRTGRHGARLVPLGVARAGACHPGGAGAPALGGVTRANRGRFRSGQPSRRAWQTRQPSGSSRTSNCQDSRLVCVTPST